ncbi:alpha/beta hydrolase family protein [Jeotgalibacillus sp. ET6]|uniref:alpha/beta hydrolase n=1 Tax=Jeotgalibacillus sp. ET6 TaxID=3037260 RepID=UPI0024188AA9|nr:alpha/beta hydrolase family protein [Jeotgalibacillus sp. ET6]MDG5471953.1 alpha/beta hydrolase family protein [Jeotgalibacillus sp. ET6]
MALIDCNFFSEALGINTSMKVILPQDTTNQIGMTGKKAKGPYPVLFLLHGLSDDDSAWIRRTSIERYVSELGIAVVMPQVHRSFYTDMEQGQRYWTFISEELPDIARSFFPLSDRREDTFTAGLSMGGYGAFKLALRHPDRFSAAASLSGVMDIAGFKSRSGEPYHDYHLIFGNKQIAQTDEDLFYLLEKRNQESGPKPMLFHCCGTDDHLYEENKRFNYACSKTSFDHVYMEDAGRGHAWDYWDEKIQDVLNWLPIEKG